MLSIKFVLATQLQKVSSAFFLMEFSTLHLNLLLYTTPQSIASAMNSFFASIGKRLANKITTTWSSINSRADLPKSQFQLAELEERFVLQQLLALKINKAIGLDKNKCKIAQKVCSYDCTICY